jgi:hypothetical protein
MTDKGDDALSVTGCADLPLGRLDSIRHEMAATGLGRGGSERPRRPRPEQPCAVVLVRAGSAQHREAIVLGGHERSRREGTAGHRTLTSRISTAGARPRRVRTPQSNCRGPAALANETGVTGDGSPCGQVGTHTGRPYERRPRRPCHYRAIHNSPDRSPADTHGQCHGCLKLRRSLPPQVTTPPDLALGARVGWRYPPGRGVWRARAVTTAFT